ncbi:hypothetical protein HNP40_000750 [Mycobacteroides chelonae]|nr:hypothetical protein [Mycobacteroides chelonae]
MSNLEMFHPQSGQGAGLLPSVASLLPSSPFDRFGTKLHRQASREVALIEANLAVRQTAVDAAGELQRAKLGTIASTGGYAMQQAAIVGQMQQQLALACPASSGDLDVLKTLTVMSMGQVVVDTASKVNRL